MFKKYYRLTKPGIIYGNLLSTIGGFYLASYGNVNYILFLFTLIGTALIIASGCVFNNCIDKDIDAKMKRTQNRSLVTGDITLKSAIIFGSILGILGGVVLLVFVNTLCFLVGLLGIFWYVIIYTFSKRFTHFSTLLGTIPGATPPVAGYVAVTGRLDLACLILFAALVFWQMSHFYAISIFRHDDYKAAKVPTISITHGIKRTKIEIIIFAILFTVTAPMLTLFGYAGISYALLIILVSFYWIRAMLEDYKLSDNKWAGTVFGNSLLVLLTLCLALSINSLFP